MKRAWVAVAVVLVGLAACSGDGASLPLCETSSAWLKVKTADGARTIARIDVVPIPAMDACQVITGCRPAMGTKAASTDAPCAEVEVMVRFTSGCVLEFTSVDGKVVTAPVEVTKVEGSDYQCRSAGGILTAFRTGLSPSMLTIDFSSGDGGVPADGGP